MGIQMNDDRIARLGQDLARATRAQAAWDEFFEPMIAELSDEYTARMAEVATTELNSAKRSDKITALSHALKITATLKGGMMAIIKDGEAAQKELARFDNIERMTAPQRRLLKIGSGY
jgi:hypothetical protein